MSGLLKGIGKIFKTVATIAAVVVIAAAVVYTAGAALGVALPGAGAVAAAGGGISGVVGAGLGAVGITSTAAGSLGAILGGALTYAGYGAAAGGIVAAATGKNIGAGFSSGAAIGAGVGAAAGTVGLYTPQIPGVNVPAPGSVSVSNLPPTTGVQGADGTVSAAAPGTAPAVPGAAPGAAAAPAASGGTGMMAYLNKNPAVAVMGGSALSGLGQGLAAGASSAAQVQAAKDAQAQITKNYNIGPNDPGIINTADVNQYAPPSSAKPASVLDQFDPASSGGQYQFMPSIGKIVWVPAGAAPNPPTQSA